MEKQGETTKFVSREETLRRYWMEKEKLKQSVFDDVVGRAGKSINRNVPLRDTINTLTERLYYGQPLTYQEYHLAIAFSFIVGERSYEDFYKNCWHETSTHYGTLTPEACEHCIKAKKESEFRTKLLK